MFDKVKVTGEVRSVGPRHRELLTCETFLFIVTSQVMQAALYAGKQHTRGVVCQEFLQWFIARICLCVCLQTELSVEPS